MELNAAQLLKEPIGAERHYHLELSGEDAKYVRGVRQVAGDIRLLRSVRSILVTGKMKALVEMSCGRCLESFHQVVAFDFQEDYYPVVDMSSGASLPLPEDSTLFIIGPDHVLSLREALRQYTLLALPMKPVCKEDCQGLCPQCGVNRNLGPCQCPVLSPDPRLVSLAELKVKIG
ncbi:MAG: DUF177 domain-containing protein [Dehalococcoidia bacterium]|nr:DUF177 domain-containing protein [Dehalococcoidia bacterium]